MAVRAEAGGENAALDLQDFEPDEKKGIVCVRMLVSSLPSQGSATESVEALVEVPWSDGNEQAIRRAALSRLDKLLRTEIERVGG